LQDVWQADQKFSTGTGYGYLNTSPNSTVISTTSQIGNTSDDPLFQDGRDNMYGYRFDDVPDGVYQLDLLFAEYASIINGQRLFDVIAEDGVVLPSHDIRYEAGTKTADSYRFFVEVTDGQLDVRFSPVTTEYRPILNAIRVIHRPDR